MYRAQVDMGGLNLAAMARFPFPWLLACQVSC